MARSNPVSSNSSNPRRAAPSVNNLVSSSRTRSARSLRNLRGEILRCRHRFRLDLESKSRGKPHGPHHSQFVFRKAQKRIANRAHNSFAQIGAPADVIKHHPGRRIHQQSIDRKIAPQHIFLRRIRIDHMVRMPPIGVANVQERNVATSTCALALRCESILLQRTLKYPRHAKFRAHRKAAWKHLLHAVGITRVRADIVIGWLASQFQIAHTTAHEIRLMPVMAQRGADSFGQCT